MDELGYLFDGLAPGRTLGVRRSSLLEIVRKLCDVDFMRKAKATDFVVCVWDKLKDAGVGKGGDPVRPFVANRNGICNSNLFACR